MIAGRSPAPSGPTEEVTMHLFSRTITARPERTLDAVPLFVPGATNQVLLQRLA